MWSFGWTSRPSSESPTSRASTSLTFMFVDVPDPVWKTSTGKWSSSSPASTCCAASAIAAASSSSTPLTPSEALTDAA